MKKLWAITYEQGWTEAHLMRQIITRKTFNIFGRFRLLALRTVVKGCVLPEVALSASGLRTCDFDEMTGIVEMNGEEEALAGVLASQRFLWTAHEELVDKLRREGR